MMESINKEPPSYQHPGPQGIPSWQCLGGGLINYILFSI